MPTDLLFIAPDAPAAPTADRLVVVGPKERLAAADLLPSLPGDLAEVWPRLVASLKPGDHGAATTTWRAADEGPAQVHVLALPTRASRHNAPSRPDALRTLLPKALGPTAHGKGSASVLLALGHDDHLEPLALGVARALPLYRQKGAAAAGGDNESPPGPSVVHVAAIGPGGSRPDPRPLAARAEGVRLAAKLVDQPTAILDVPAFVAEARRVAEDAGAEVRVIDGDALAEGGFGGLIGVGKAARRGPALVHLSAGSAADDAETWVWVGKGIVYDTGGLSLKGKAHMPGMKRDMGGAAAVLGAFSAVARDGVPDGVRLHALLCLAENAIGPEATRPDDVLTLKSGKTVEINNTDAEGRLVLGDGVAYAVASLAPDVIVDLATLTGAQLMATGRLHAAIVCNDDALESKALAVGKATGDLVHPLPFAPELFRKEFRSTVADLKNSVKDRMNAQSSCAGQFVAEHLGDYLGDDRGGRWLHVDMAGPAHAGARGTGYGVALLAGLLRPT